MGTDIKTYKVTRPHHPGSAIVQAEGYTVLDAREGSVEFLTFDEAKAPQQVAFFAQTTSVILQSETSAPESDG